MKDSFIILLAILLSASVFAQSPEKMSYQAVIRNSSDILITSTLVGMQISILQGSPTGTMVYVETQTATTNANGLITVEIGSGIPLTGTFSTIDWAIGPYFIKTETDPAGGTNYTITGTSQLLSVPYALYAKTAESITGAAGGFIHFIGELYGGGIVVSVWKESGVEHGLIASLVDLSPNLIWTTGGYQSILVPGGASSPFDGLANSNAIVAQAGTGTTYAASLCRAYSAVGDGGQMDWYLPAVWELNQCYNAAVVVNTILGAIEGFQFNYYWSSTEGGNSLAWYHSFYSGYADANLKGNTYRVRAVRRF
ncbi:MAG: DUF1566 domain-containing protein [Bacteroidales bacterium]|nr:DUF1566 domain-containing protein [Bacteroidales bacterium]MCF8455837.1 DUF1566 domain-containing protein [Bacteroidales bacterium]